METEYKVEVLHYLNPHLIWVEVLEEISTNTEMHEQIGLFGMLPVEQEWSEATREAISEALLDAKECLFILNYIDRRSSILKFAGEDKIIHKFGDILIVKNDDSMKSLSEILSKKNLAVRDDTEFLTRLFMGNLKTKLDKIQHSNLLKILVKSAEKMENPKNLLDSSTQSHTSLSHTIQDINQMKGILTEKNLQLHNKQMQDNKDKIAKKAEDSSKDIYVASIGRGSTQRPLPKMIGETGAKFYDFERIKEYKRLKNLQTNMLDTSIAAKNVTDKDNNGKTLCFEESTPKDIQSSSVDEIRSSDSIERIKVSSNIDTKKVSNNRIQWLLDLTKKTEKLVVCGPPEVDFTNLDPKVVSENAHIRNPVSYVHQAENENDTEKVSSSLRIQRILDLTKKTEKLVVCGPPEVDFTNLVPKVVSENAHIKNPVSYVHQAENENDTEKVSSSLRIQRILDLTKKTEKLVVCGPPEVDFTNLVPKVVSENAHIRNPVSYVHQAENENDTEKVSSSLRIQRILDLTKKTEKLVVCGPPEVDFTNLVPKVVNENAHIRNPVSYVHQAENENDTEKVSSSLRIQRILDLTKKTEKLVCGPPEVDFTNLVPKVVSENAHIRNSVSYVHQAENENDTKKVSSSLRIQRILDLTKESEKFNYPIDSSKIPKDDFVKTENPMNIVAKDNLNYSTETKSSIPLNPILTPKVYWRQDRMTATIRIEVIGVHEYSMNILPRSIEFSTTVNNSKYAFLLETYGVTKPNTGQHEAKSPYVFVKLEKLIPRMWLTLTKDDIERNWIIYEPDNIDTSSDEKW